MFQVATSSRPVPFAGICATRLVLAVVAQRRDFVGEVVRVVEARLRERRHVDPDCSAAAPRCQYRVREMPLTRDETRGSGVALAIDLVNTWDELEPEPDLIEGLQDVRTWLEWHGLSAAAKRMRRSRRRPRPRAAGPVRPGLRRRRRGRGGEPPQRARARVRNTAGARAGRRRLAPPLVAGRERRAARSRRVRDRGAARRLPGARLGALRPLRRRPVPLRVRRPQPEPVAPLLLHPLRRPRRPGAVPRAQTGGVPPRRAGAGRGGRGARRVPRRSPGTGSGPGARSTSRSRAACSRRSGRRCRRACRRRRRSSPGRERSGGRRCR